VAVAAGGLSTGLGAALNKLAKALNVDVKRTSRDIAQQLNEFEEKEINITGRLIPEIKMQVHNYEKNTVKTLLSSLDNLVIGYRTVIEHEQKKAVKSSEPGAGVVYNTKIINKFNNGCNWNLAMHNARSINNLVDNEKTKNCWACNCRQYS